MPHKSHSNSHKDATQRLCLPHGLSTRTMLLSLLINTLLASLLSFFGEVLSCKAEAFHLALSLSLITALLAKIWYYPHLSLWLKTQTLLQSLQAEATQGHTSKESVIWRHVKSLFISKTLNNNNKMFSICPDNWIKSGAKFTVLTLFLHNKPILDPYQFKLPKTKS